MSRRSQGKPPLVKPRAILGYTPRITHGGRGHKAKTLIGQASRALYMDRRAGEAEAMRDMLLAAEPAEYRAILAAFVDFFPSDAIGKHPAGDPARHWASSYMRIEQRGKAA